MVDEFGLPVCAKHEIEMYRRVCDKCDDEMREENTRLRTLLKRLEWSDGYIDGYGNETYSCPICGKEKAGVCHAPDCELAKALEEE